jgi:hypothetical protein
VRAISAGIEGLGCDGQAFGVEYAKNRAVVGIVALNMAR